MTIMRTIAWALGVAAVLPLAAAHAQTAPPIIVPTDGKVDLKTFPQMGEEIHGALTTTQVDRGPLGWNTGNTRVCSVAGLWECHTWYNADNTGVHFYAIRQANGSVRLASTEFTWRMRGDPGEEHLCRTPAGSKAEVCDGQPFSKIYYLYDEWFENYDRPAEGRLPAYINVHEHHALIANHR